MELSAFRPPMREKLRKITSRENVREVPIFLFIMFPLIFPRGVRPNTT